MTNEWNGKTKVNNKWNYEKMWTMKILKKQKRIINEIIEKRNKQRYRNKKWKKNMEKYNKQRYWKSASQ